MSKILGRTLDDAMADAENHAAGLEVMMSQASTREAELLAEIEQHKADKLAATRELVVMRTALEAVRLELEQALRHLRRV